MANTERIDTPKEAEAFLARHGIVLRYAVASAVPLASLRAACGPANAKAALERSIHLTNHLLGRAIGLEVNVISTRLILVHRTWMPALYRLVRRDRRPDDLEGLTLNARRAYALVVANREVSAGDVRKHLGIPTTPKHDAAYDALAELQRHLLVDRGPFVVPKTGIPYLSREGYPYHLVHRAHDDLVRAARAMAIDDALNWWLTACLDAGLSATPRTLASLFRQFLTASEIAGWFARRSAAC